MTHSGTPAARIAIACGGTGGHLFPGLAVARELSHRGCEVLLLISPKEVDQQAVRSAAGVEIVTLPAAAFQSGGRIAFARGLLRSWRVCSRLFKTRRLDAVLAMGGFTAAPAVLAARQSGIKSFLHESNTIPGRANRWLARWVEQAFVGFPEARDRLAARSVAVTGTPVRSSLRASEAAKSRLALGLDPNRPVLLVMGGSQGARGINRIVMNALPVLARHALQWQWLHLTGPHDEEALNHAYQRHGLKAVVRSFLGEMEIALGAATACVSRAGASSLAELAALRIPSLLLPYPTAADDHQWHNARAFESTGAAMLLTETDATPDRFSAQLRKLMESGEQRTQIKNALAQWDAPDAAEQIAGRMLQAVGQAAGSGTARNAAPAGESRDNAVTVENVSAA